MSHSAGSQCGTSKGRCPESLEQELGQPTLPRGQHRDLPPELEQGSTWMGAVVASLRPWSSAPHLPPQPCSGHLSMQAHPAKHAYPWQSYELWGYRARWTVVYPKDDRKERSVGQYSHPGPRRRATISLSNPVHPANTWILAGGHGRLGCRGSARPRLCCPAHRSRPTKHRAGSGEAAQGPE